MGLYVTKDLPKLNLALVKLICLQSENAASPPCCLFLSRGQTIKNGIPIFTHYVSTINVVDQ